MYRKKPAPGIYTDVYDTPAWKRMMGEVIEILDRIGIHFCIDGIPAFTYKVGVCFMSSSMHVCHCFLRQFSFVSISGSILVSRRVCSTLLAAVATLQGQQHFDECTYARTSIGGVAAQVLQANNPRRAESSHTYRNQHSLGHDESQSVRSGIFVIHVCMLDITSHSNQPQTESRFEGS